MSQIIIYETPQGIAIIHPAPDWTGTIEELAAKDVPEGVAYQFAEAADIPEDRTFRAAWNADLTINIAKAQEIQRNRWRIARKPILEGLDVAFMRAVETGDTARQAEIAAEKQDLRDVTDTPLPEDVEGIKNTWPEVLGPQPTE